MGASLDCLQTKQIIVVLNNMQAIKDKSIDVEKSFIISSDVGRTKISARIKLELPIEI